MLLFNTTIWLIGTAILAIIIIVMRIVFGRPVSYLIMTAVFGVYLLNVIRYTFFPFPMDPQLLALMRMTGSEPGMMRVNLLPFHSQYYDTILEDKSNYLNVLMTIPYGLLLPFLVRMNTRRMLVWALAIGLVIEALQGIIDLGLGFTYRTVDINDVIFNFAGAMLGWGLLRLLLRLPVVQKELASWLPGMVKR